MTLPPGPCIDPWRRTGGAMIQKLGTKFDSTRTYLIITRVGEWSSLHIIRRVLYTLFIYTRHVKNSSWSLQLPYILILSKWNWKWQLYKLRPLGCLSITNTTSLTWQRKCLMVTVQYLSKFQGKNERKCTEMLTSRPNPARRHGQTARVRDRCHWPAALPVSPGQVS